MSFPSYGKEYPMPYNNRVSGNVALKTNDMWSKTIGKASTAEEDASAASEHAASLMLLARMSNVSAESRGACKRCGLMGHLTFQCRNAPATSVDKVDSDSNSSSSDSDSEVDLPEVTVAPPSKKRKHDSKDSKKEKKHKSKKDKKHKSHKKSSSKDKKRRKESRKE